MQIFHKSILLVLTKTRGRCKTALVLVTSPWGRWLIPGFNSLMPSDRLRWTNGSAMTSALFPDFFKQVSHKHRTIFDLKVTVWGGYSAKIFDANTHMMWENDSELSSLSNLYKNKTKERNNYYNFYAIKKQSCPWIELSGCLECRKAELVSIWTRTTCWATRSRASVKSSRLLLWLTLPATTSTLHHDLFHDSMMLVEIKKCSASCLTLITWWRETYEMSI